MEGEPGAWAVPIPPRPRSAASARALRLPAVPAWERTRRAPVPTKPRLPGGIASRRRAGTPERDAWLRGPRDRRRAPPRASPGTARTGRRRGSLEGPARTRACHPPLSPSPASPSGARPFLSPNGRLLPVRRSPPGPPPPPPPPPPLQLPPDLARLRSAPRSPPSHPNEEGTDPGLEAPGSAVRTPGASRPASLLPPGIHPRRWPGRVKAQVRGLPRRSHLAGPGRMRRPGCGAEAPRFQPQLWLRPKSDGQPVSACYPSVLTEPQ
ncbi:uncharacterized protein LOC107402070 isoform X1 [Peromyscus maniculatus bairdii]|uniref:uncharacterized protein LOC107402070 isoform X1 n=1 Tax=Peromyscus maniculatus bairdii TaxID=230844 RepID=UPI003FD6648D